MHVAELAGFALLCFFPGAWLTFGLGLPGVGLVTRALLAVVVSPVVVLAQFYAIRLVGVPFSSTVLVLVFGNLPALFFVHLRWTASRELGSLRQVLPYVLVWVIPVGLLFFYFNDLARNALRAHTFLHADLVYAIANGALKVEEAQLAGLTSGYPWGGHVHQAVMSWVLGTSPVGSFAWTNIVLLIAGVTLMTRVTARLGGGPLARVLTVVWVLFAVNAVGHVLGSVLPDDIISRYPVWGDGRFTPWLRKYSLWNQHPHAQGLLAGILLFMVAPRSEAFSKSAVVLVWVMVAGLAAIYPVFMPAVAVLLMARFASDAWGRPTGGVRKFIGNNIPLGTIALVGAVGSIVTLAVVGEHRTAGAGIGLASYWLLKVKSVQSLIVLMPLLAATSMLFLTRRKELAPRSGVLFFAGVASALLYLVFSIRGAMEYKFMFTTAMFLAPLASIGFDSFLEGRGRLRVMGYALLLLLFVGTAADKFVYGRYMGPTPFEIRIDEFPVRLPEGHELERSVEAIIGETTPNTVVVVDSLDIHLPVFVQRSLFAPPLTDERFIGVDLKNDFLLGNNRGYGYEVVYERQAVTRRLFRSEYAEERLSALEEIRRLQRPVVVLLELNRHSELLETLTASQAGKILHTDGRWATWVVEP